MRSKQSFMRTRFVLFPGNKAGIFLAASAPTKAAAARTRELKEKAMTFSGRLESCEAAVRQSFRKFLRDTLGCKKRRTSSPFSGLSQEDKSVVSDMENYLSVKILTTEEGSNCHITEASVI